MVILKHWHKLPLVENQIAPANSDTVWANFNKEEKMTAESEVLYS
jgi:hypothetical protein